MRYLEGKRPGPKLLYERLAREIDLLGGTNYLAFMTGILVGTGAPCTGCFPAPTQSRLTGLMAHSSLPKKRSTGW